MILHVLTTLFQDAYLGVEHDAGYFLEWLTELDTNFPKQDLRFCSLAHTRMAPLCVHVCVCVCVCCVLLYVTYVKLCK